MVMWRLARLIGRVGAEVALVESVLGGLFHTSAFQCPLPLVGRSTLRRRMLFASP